MSATLDLTLDLIRCPSVTPVDANCQELMIQRLEKIGFHIERLRFGDVDNFWARRGTTAPVFTFAGHTDVVPTGTLTAWLNDPFQPEIRDGVLYGRGAADMKGSLAAMVVACENFVAQHPNHQGSIAFLITSDEEGVAKDGTVKVVEHLEARQEKITWCLVGEPSSSKTLGDVIKNGRRGSLNGILKVIGIQGHVAYPQLADNPIHKAAPALAELAAEVWDNGNAFFPATSFQISNINSGTGATNVIPGHLEMKFNFRFSTAVTPAQLQERVSALFAKHQLKVDLNWTLGAEPFLTKPGKLRSATADAIKSVTQQTVICSTGGGTSDGRFIAPTGTEVIELGTLHATAHQIDECISVDDLKRLVTIYEQILSNIF